MAQYELKQYNKNSEVADSEKFMALQKDKQAMATRKETQYNVEVTNSNNNDSFKFYDEAVTNLNLSAGKHYYFHGKIKKMNSIQSFDIKLYDSNDSDKAMQYIKTIIVEKGAVINSSYPEENWVDVEFIFTPQENYNSLLFELERDVSIDYRKYKRYPKIAYEELSVIKNYPFTDSQNIIKLGVQSRPGFLMCINGEEIRTSRSGIYELKNGIMTISFFSACAAVKEKGNEMSEWMDSVNTSISDLELGNKKYHNGDRGPGTYSDEQYEKAQEALDSQCFFNTSKKDREISKFTLDYLYNKD